MLIIRFSRVGKRNHAQYRIVLTEKTSPVKGKFVELLGSYDPHQKQAVLKEDRIKYWLGNGVQCSDSVFNLFVAKELIKGEKRKVRVPEKEVKEEVVEEGKAVAEKPEEAKEAVVAEEKITEDAKKDEVVVEEKTENSETPVAEKVEEKKEVAVEEKK